MSDLNQRSNDDLRQLISDAAGILLQREGATDSNAAHISDLIWNKLCQLEGNG